MPNAPRQTDLELGQLRDGYPALASWIAQDPDNETFIFRKFDKLAARNILHLQAQLFAIERELEDLDDDLRRSNDLEALQSLRRWETLVEHGRDPNKTESKLVQKLQDLKALLKEYCAFFVIQRKVYG
jgi:hypothetical protein